MRWVVCAVILAGCGRVGFDAIPSLVVTTLEDRMAGPSSIASVAELPPAITDLSLREALAIAANHEGPDWIEFDLQMFPASAPAVIRLGAMLEVAGAETTVDASLRGVILDVAAGYDGPLIHLDGDAEDARIDGLMLIGGTAPRVEVIGAARTELVGLSIYSAAGVAVRIDNTRSAALRASTIDGPAGNAVEIERSTDVTVERTTITRTLGDPIFAAMSTNLRIEGNSIIIEPGSTGRGVVFEGEVNSSRVLDNFIDPGSAQLVRLLDSSNNEIVGNILDRGEVGVALFGTSLNNLVLRNAVVMNPEPFYVAGTATGNRLLHNTLYMCGGIANGAADTEVVNNLEADQGFVDPAAFDFHLEAGNPAIDAATDLGLDLLPDPSARYLGAAPDLGAIETR
jgi:parallel beta-helix repeat protein